MAFGSTAAGRADLEFTATTGAAKSGIEELRAVYSRETAGMSADALKLTAAQERLDAALVRSHGAASRSVVAAELNLAATQKATTAAVTEGAGAYRAAEKDVDKFGRGLLSGTGLMQGFGRAAAFASTAFLGGAGLVFAIRSVINASKDEEVALASVKNALADTGNSWTQYSGQVEKATAAIERHTGYTKEELDSSLAQLIRRTGNVTQSISLLSTVTDLARGKNIDLASSTNYIIKALNGQYSGLTRAGIQVVKLTTQQDALKASGVAYSAQALAAAKAADTQASVEATLGAVRQKYGNAAAAYLQTEAGKQALLNAQLKDAEAVIGRALTPAIETLLGDLGTWLDHLQKTGELQRDANTAVKDGTEIVHGATAAFHLLEPPIELVIKALGGLKNAAEIALILGLAAKARSAAGALGLITAASGKTRDAVVADAAIEEKAIAGVGAAAATTAEEETALAGGGAAAAGRAGLLGGLGGFALPLLAIPAGQILASQFDAKGPAGGQFSTIAQIEAAARQPGTGGDLARDLLKKIQAAGGPQGKAAGSALAESAVSPLSFSDVLPAIQNGSLTPSAIRQLKGRFTDQGAYNGALRLAQSLVAPATRSDAATSGPGASGAAGQGGSGPVVGLSYPTQLALANAQISGSQSAQLAADNAAAAEITKLLAQPGLTHAEILSLKSQLGQYAGDARSVQQQQAQAAKDAKSAAAAAARARTAKYVSGVSTHAQVLENDVKKAGGAASPALFPAEGPSFYGAAYAHNRPFAVAPPKNGGKGPYQTKLTAGQEKDFRKWVADNNVPFDPNAKIVDYDMRGYWLNVIVTGKGKWAGGGTHFPDTYKTPYDTTFSGQSKYATKDNPFEWKGNNLVNSRSGQLIFGADGSLKSFKASESKLIADYRKDSNDTKLSAATRAHYAGLVITETQHERKTLEADQKKVTEERQKLAKGYEKHLKEQLKAEKTAQENARKLRDQLAQNRLTSAQLAEARAGTNTKKLAAAHKLELAADLAIIAQDKKDQQGLTGLALAAAKNQTLQDQISYAQLKQSLKPTGPTAAQQNEAQFLSSFSSIINAYSPNGFPKTGATDTRLYELVHETRQTNGHLKAIRRSTKFPGTYGAKLAVEAAYG